MKLSLIGHDYKYAVEQIMLTLFPDERPEYLTTNSPLSSLNSRSNPQEAGDQWSPLQPNHQFSPDNSQLSIINYQFAAPAAMSRLSIGGTYAQATTVLHYLGRRLLGTARVRSDKLTDKLITNRLLQRIIKQSFYRAAIKAIPAPAWGSLTGIRPAKIVETMLESGASDITAANKLIDEYYVSERRARLCVDVARSTNILKSVLKANQIAIYIGIPFCPTRCAYCSFVSNSVEKSFSLIDPFVETLLREIKLMGRLAEELALHVISVYIGGGTPTSLPCDDLEAIMRTLKTSFDIAPLIDYTVEAGRPDTITKEKLKVIKQLGGQRVCVNPQSMSEEVLAAIGRRHTPEDILESARLVRDVGMTLNMDVIAGLPSDSPEGFRNTLDAVINLKPENITVHTLSRKKGSRIMLEGTPIPSATEVAEMLEYASNALTDCSYYPYYLYRQKFTSGGFENIGWSLPGHEGMYNKLMMEDLCTVFALGGGGVTKLVLPNGRIERIFNAKYPKEYIEHPEKLADKASRIRKLITLL